MDMMGLCVQLDSILMNSGPTVCCCGFLINQPLIINSLVHPHDPEGQERVQLDSHPHTHKYAHPHTQCIILYTFTAQNFNVFMIFHINVCGEQHEGAMDPGRRVSFEKEYSSKVAAVLEQMKETLRRAGQVDDIEV